ncbi:MAG TPA: DUF6603 domain-containing protein, partial [Longimicrobium sp.]|nr:DUF6603 domain-containing protein [Longimicrobium sp.]
WGGAFDFAGALGRMRRAAGALGLPARLGPPRHALLSRFYTPDNPALAGVRELRIPLMAGDLGRDGYAETGIVVLPVPPRGQPGAPPAGLLVGPYAVGDVSGEVELGGAFVLRLRGGADAEAPVAMAVWPGAVAGYASGDPVTLDLALEVEGAPNRPWLIAGARDGSRAEVGRARFAVELSGPATAPELRLVLAAEEFSVLLDLAGGDSFVGSALGNGSAGVTADVAVVWSSRNGVSLQGRGDMRVQIPLEQSLGFARLDSLTLGLEAGDSGLAATAGVTGQVKLGPMTATVQNVGVRLAARPAPPGEGTFGDLALDWGFKGPDGVGIRVDAGPVRGGGFLSHDEARGQYAGALELDFEGIALKAVGLLSTRMPDGSPLVDRDGGRTFSLLLVIAGEFTPIQLGYGFTLNGVGGLVGLNRAVDVDVLRAGLRDRTLDAVLFPADPVGEAPRLLPALARAFPVRVGGYAVGPMARIGWGTPTLLTIDLGVVVQFPEPVRIVALGRLRLALPDERSALVRMNMDVLGVIDLKESTASVDATLYDSHVAGLPITGDMAMRASWGEKPGFALSAGGFHPAYRPPPGFPSLRRLAIALTNGDNPRVRLEAYLALTSNTVQTGARVEARASALGFTVEGWLAFDALIQLDPFGFMVNIGAAAALKRGRTTLMSVRLAVDLSGPSPWRARGEAHFSVLFISGTVRFDVRSGRAGARPPRTSVNVGMEVWRALQDPANWTAQLPASGGGMVTLRKVEAAPGELLAHPLGSLGFRQRVAPMGVRLEHWGNADVDGVKTIRVERVTYGDGDDPLASTRPLRDAFAPAQFRTLSDQQKLSAPSFQQYEAGRALGLGGTDFDPEPRLPVPTDHMIIFDDSLKGRSAARGAAPGVLVLSAAPFSPAGRRGGRPALAPLGVEVRETRYALVDPSAPSEGRGRKVGLRAPSSSESEAGVDYATALDLAREAKRAGAGRMRVVSAAGGAR